MAKRGGTSQLQIDIINDEELNYFIDQPGLCHVYAEWCGPCLGMLSTLKKIKSEVGEQIHMATCKSDQIEALERFRMKSEPTWLFVIRGSLVNIMYGTNIPKFRALVNTELKRSKSLTLKIDFIPIRDLLPIEQEKINAIAEAELRLRIATEAQEKKARKQYLDYCTAEILNYTSGGFGVTIFGPQVTKNDLPTILKIAENEKLSTQDRQFIKLTPEHINVLHYSCNNPIPEDVLQELYNKELLVYLWKARDMKNIRSIEEILNEFINKLTKPAVSPETKQTVPPILETLEIKIKGKKEELSNIEQEEDEDMELNLQISQYSEHSEHSEHSEQIEQEDENSEIIVTSESEPSILTRKSSSYIRKVIIPPVWTPGNQRTTAAAIYTFFRNQTSTFLPPDPVPEPPHLIAVFDAWKRRDITDVMNKYHKEILAYGYFTTEEPETAQLLANTTRIYERKIKNRSDKLVVKVAKRTSHAVLALASHGPTYVSPNTDIGLKEGASFFPNGYICIDNEPVEVEVKKAKAKKAEEKKADEVPTAAAVTPAESVPPKEVVPPTDGAPPAEDAPPSEDVSPESRSSTVNARSSKDNTRSSKDNIRNSKSRNSRSSNSTAVPPA